MFRACFIPRGFISLDIMSRDNGHLVTDLDKPFSDCHLATTNHIV